MRKLMVFLLILLGIIGVSDWFVTTFAEGAIEERIEEDIEGSAHVEIDSWPVIARAAVTQEVGRLTADLSNVVLDEIELESIQIRIIDLKLSRTRLLRGEIDPKSIRTGSVSVSVSQTAIAEAAGLLPQATDISSGTVGVDGGHLTVEAGDFPTVTIPFPEDVLPCSATGTFSGNEVRLNCSVDEIPPMLLRNLPG